MVEPEGMAYEFPPENRVLLTFRGAGARFRPSIDIAVIPDAALA